MKFSKLAISSLAIASEFKNISINIQVNINDYILVLPTKLEDFFRLFHEEMPCAFGCMHLH